VKPQVSPSHNSIRALLNTSPGHYRAITLHLLNMSPGHYCAMSLAPFEYESRALLCNNLHLFNMSLSVTVRYP
jgi:hypothetical protein